MKGRPRRIENKAAEYLSDFFNSLDLKPVERVPILGRTGPDLTTNPFKLVVDVKSRQSIPKKPLPEEHEIVVCPGKWIGTRLSNLRLLGYCWASSTSSLVVSDGCNVRTVKKSKTIQRWLDHMDEWRLNEMPNGISCLILHKSGAGKSKFRMFTKHSLTIIKYEQIGDFHARYKYFHNLALTE